MSPVDPGTAGELPRIPAPVPSGPSVTLRTSVVLRLVLVAGLALALLVPIGFIGLLIQERRERRDAAVQEVTGKWGGQQTVTGPILSIPVRVPPAGGPARTLHVLPENLSFHAVLTPETRYRGIFKVILYAARITLEADFPLPAPEGAPVQEEDLLWSEAFVSGGVSDPKGIQSLSGSAGGQPLGRPERLLQAKDVLAGMLSFRSPLAPGKVPARVTLEMELNGSDEIRFAPLGQHTKGTVECPWGDPSFVGDFLPEQREITAGTFRAAWNVSSWSRALPQQWLDSPAGQSNPTVGVQLFQVVDEYRKSARAVKYAILFVALTFLAFTVVDVLTRTPFHPVHYALVGLALVLFYLLLLSLSEYVVFHAAYGAASLATILLITLYVRGVVRRWGVAGAVAAVLAVLYAFLLVLLQMEDYALLLGSGLLFASLALVMHLTRRIDWFDLGNGTKAS
jgi:inner membrane protein